MIICPCGNPTMREREAESGARLTYERCGACGRCGIWRLSGIGGQLFKGERARVLFNTIDCWRPSHERPFLPATDVLTKQTGHQQDTKKYKQNTHGWRYVPTVRRR